MILRLAGLLVLAAEGVVFKSTAPTYDPLEPVKPGNGSVPPPPRPGKKAQQRARRRGTELKAAKAGTELNSVHEETGAAMESMVGTVQSLINGMLANFTNTQQHLMDQLSSKVDRVDKRLDQYINRTNTLGKRIDAKFRDVEAKINNTRSHLNTQLRVFINQTKIDTQLFQGYNKKINRAEKSLDMLDGYLSHTDKLYKVFKANATKSETAKTGKNVLTPNTRPVAKLNGIVGRGDLAAQLGLVDNASAAGSAGGAEGADRSRKQDGKKASHRTGSKPVDGFLLEEYIERAQKMDEWHGDYHQKFLQVGKILQNISLAQRMHDNVNTHLEKVMWLMESLVLSMHRRVLELETKANLTVPEAPPAMPDAAPAEDLLSSAVESLAEIDATREKPAEEALGQALAETASSAAPTEAPAPAEGAPAEGAPEEEPVDVTKELLQSLTKEG